MTSGKSIISMAFGFVAGIRTSAGKQEHAEQHHERVREVRRQVEERLDSLHRRQFGAHQAGQELSCGLHGALRPAELLRAEGADVFGELGGRDDVLAVDEAPPRELRAVD